MSTVTTLFCLLLIQMVSIAPFPYNGPSQQNKDFAYRDSDETGNAIQERNALRRNGSKKSSLSLFYNRVTRDLHSCVEKGSRKVEICGDDQVVTVTCQKKSWGCASSSQASSDCREIREYLNVCGIKVTDCECK